MPRLCTHADMHSTQISFKEYIDPFTGSENRNPFRGFVRIMPF